MVKRKSCLLWIAFLVGGASQSAEALAAHPPGKEEFDKGAELFQNKDYAGALPWFEKAYALTGGRPSVVRALAQCERALKNYDAAIQRFEEYLRTHPADKEQILETIRLVRAEADVMREHPSEGPTPKLSSPDVNDPVAQETVAEDPGTGTQDGLLDSPLFWIAITLVAAGGAVGAGLLATRGDPEIYGGTSGVILDR